MADEEDSTSQEQSDPLSFFTAGGDSSDSDSDEDEETHSNEPSNEPKESVEEKSPKSKLPSPHTLFATVGRPAFLETKEESHLDWNSLSKRYEPSVTYTAPPVQFTARPEESDEYSDDAVISSAPIKYKKEASDIQKHLLVHHKRTAEALKILDDRGDNAGKDQGNDSSNVFSSLFFPRSFLHL